jgi:acetyl-CoA acetyltransferase
MPRPYNALAMTDSRNRACIVGIGESAFTRWGGQPDKSELELSLEAILAAAADAGLEPSEIDGFASYSDDSSAPERLMIALGTRQLRLASMVWGGGGGGCCGALAHAAAAVESGRARHVAVFRGLAQGQSFRFGRFHPWSAHADFCAPFGLMSPPQLFALLLRRHMHEYGTTAEQLGEVALACRDNAGRNPRAVMRDRPLNMEAYLASRMIADPLRLYDCCLESDGASAVIVSTAERARDLAARPVEILAAAQGSGRGWGSGMLGGHNMPEASYATGNAGVMAAELFAQAGVTPEDIDVAQIYDAFTGTVLFALEDYGFCGRGESGPYVAEGNLRWPEGRLPINTAGGILSEAYIHGFNLVVEGVRQLRGQSTSQVAEARLCLVTGGESVTPTSGAILGV